MEVKFPNVSVELTGTDGNAFSIMGRVSGALRDAGASQEDIEEYRNDAMSGDYDNLLVVTMRTVDVT